MFSRTPSTRSRSRARSRAGVLAAVVATAALGLSACGGSAGAGKASDAGSSASTSSSSDQGWPRTVQHEKGSTEIPEQPKKIVSTSITLTGSLLAIDAPVTASAATTVGPVTDDQGFFSQWGSVAKDRGVEVLYPNLEFDEEALIAADPDLIVVSSTGADSTADQYEKLSDIAPTIVLDYGKQSWQDLSEQLGEATGQEDGAAKAVESFDARVNEVKGKITVPAGDTNVVVWNGTAKDTAFAKPGSAHAELMESLGLTVKGADDSVDTSETARSDFAFVSIENTVGALKGSTVFLASGNDEDAGDLMGTKVLQDEPAVKAKSVYALGLDSFRIDYYSALNIVDKVEAALS